MEADDDAIQIVLQQYDFNVEQTVQAFLEGTMLSIIVLLLFSIITLSHLSHLCSRSSLFLV